MISGTSSTTTYHLTVFTAVKKHVMAKLYLGASITGDNRFHEDGRAKLLGGLCPLVL